MMDANFTPAPLPPLSSSTPLPYQFVRALREQLAELYGLADYSLGVGGGLGVDVSPKALQGYGFRVDALERGLLVRQQEVTCGGVKHSTSWLRLP
jgi:hypothetical protein